MPLNLRLIVHAILEEYALPREGDHGVAHWARVLENGLRLARTTGANVEWADGRASFGVVPKMVTDEWGIDLDCTNGQD